MLAHLHRVLFGFCTIPNVINLRSRAAKLWAPGSRWSSGEGPLNEETSTLSRLELPAAEKLRRQSSNQPVNVAERFVGAVSKSPSLKNLSCPEYSNNIESPTEAGPALLVLIATCQFRPGDCLFLEAESRLELIRPHTFASISMTLLIERYMLVGRGLRRIFGLPEEDDRSPPDDRSCLTADSTCCRSHVITCF
jgi:hypothetical protein